MSVPGNSFCVTAARQLIFAFACVAFVQWAGASEDIGETLLVEVHEGQSVSEVLNAYRSAGFPLAYSTNLVKPEMMVRQVPLKEEPVALINDILAPFDLELKLDNQLYLVTRKSSPPAPVARPNLPASDSPSAEHSNPIEQVTVTASLYRLGREDNKSSHWVDQQTLEALPTIGEDPLRALQRLPGAATQGISSKLRFRGGSGDETGVLINGHKIQQPFHIRDFQSLFSAVDTRIADRIQVYSGGFPAQYGNQLSGLVLIDSVSPEETSVTELGLSVFNTSFFSGGTFNTDETGKWLFSARRGNLDLILDKRYGEPSYYDLFGELQFSLSPTMQLTLNALHANDQVLLKTEVDPVEDEISASEIKNTNVWIKLDQRWSDHLRSTSALSHSGLNLQRKGINNQTEKLFGQVRDDRVTELFGLRQDWVYAINQAHTLRFGAEYQKMSARYDYAASAEYRDFYASFQSIEGDFTRTFNGKIAGEVYSLYFSDQWRINNVFTLNYGSRWDRQTYTDLESDRSLFSPRVSAVFALTKNTDLTASWGRYVQSQDINNLQIEDGEQKFHRAQRSEQMILGLQHRLNDTLSMRLELYQNSLTRVMPRFENILDPIALIPELEPDRYHISPDRGRSRGVELTLSKSSDERLNWWISYVNSSAEDRVDGMWQPRSWDQKHAVQAGVIYDDERWQFSAAVNVHSGWRATSLLIDEAALEDEPFLALGSRNAEQLNTFGSLDVKIARTFSLPKGSLHAFFEVSNVSGRKNQCCTDYSLEEDETGFFLEKDREFGLPFLPAVGVVWKF